MTALLPETDIGATKEGHETDGREGTMLRFILFRVFVAFNIGFGVVRSHTAVWP